MPTVTPKPVAKLTAKNSQLYVATKAPKGGDYSDDGATSINFRAVDIKDAKKRCKARNLRLEGRLLSRHKPEQTGWHIRSRARFPSSTFHVLFFFDQRIESGTGPATKNRFKAIANFLNEKQMRPIKLCAGDYPSTEAAQKEFNKD